MTETGMKKIRTINGRLSATYAEAVVLLHHRSLDDQAAPSQLVMATVVAAIYGREVLTVFDDIKRGMVP